MQRNCNTVIVFDLCGLEMSNGGPIAPQQIFPQSFSSWSRSNTWWALKLPVAPANFAAFCTCIKLAFVFPIDLKTAISLLSRVGEAGWPWVLDNMGVLAWASESSDKASKTSSKCGRYTLWRDSFIDKGMAVLLISWEVKPKWMNSLYLPKSSLSNSFLIKYSTALTSWLVVFSISLISLASSSEKCLYMLRKSSKILVLSCWSCGSGISQRQ